MMFVVFEDSFCFVSVSLSQVFVKDGPALEFSFVLFGFAFPAFLLILLQLWSLVSFCFDFSFSSFCLRC